MLKRILFVILSLFLFSGFFSFEAVAGEKKQPYEIINDSEGIYVIRVNSDKAKKKLVPYVVDELTVNSDIYEKTGAKFVVNAGFFDPKNSKTVSYVIIDGNVVLNPMNNDKLVQNKALNPFLGKILNRSEFRIIKNKKGEIYFDIAPHHDGLENGDVLKHSIQAGPMLVPSLRLEEEFFVLTENGKVITESASALHKHPRTAIGIKNNEPYIFIVTDKAPMTLKELSELAKKYEMDKAMAFDGGGSTSFDSNDLHIISDKDDTARKLKSFLILK